MSCPNLMWVKFYGANYASPGCGVRLNKQSPYQKRRNIMSFKKTLFVASATVLGLVALLLVFCAPDPTPPRTALDDQPAKMLSAFFGLDNALPGLRFKDADGMPLTFSKRVQDPDSLEPSAFTVITRSGVRVHPLHVTTRPAHEASKRHSVLLIGEFGNAPEDPPVRVEVTGHLVLAGDEDAQGLSVAVTPLENGPSLVMAYSVSPSDFADDLPLETRQIIVVVWNGGVEPVAGVTRDNHRLGYRLETIDGGSVQPIALGDIGGDNYEYLFLDTQATVMRVSMKSGLLMDPRADANPTTSVGIAAAIDSP